MPYSQDACSKEACDPLWQATVSGFRLVTRENVFKVCDQPHPLLVAQIVDACTKAELYKAYEGMKVSVLRPGCLGGVRCLPKSHPSLDLSSHAKCLGFFPMDMQRYAD